MSAGILLSRSPQTCVWVVQFQIHTDTDSILQISEAWRHGYIFHKDATAGYLKSPRDAVSIQKFLPTLSLLLASGVPQTTATINQQCLVPADVLRDSWATWLNSTKRKDILLEMMTSCHGNAFRITFPVQWESTRVPSHYKDDLSKYGNFHYKDNLYNGNSYTSKTTSLYWDGQQIPLTAGQYLMRSFGVFFAISLDKLSNKQSSCWWFETLTVMETVLWRLTWGSNPPMPVIMRLCMW